MNAPSFKRFRPWTSTEFRSRCCRIQVEVIGRAQKKPQNEPLRSICLLADLFYGAFLYVEPSSSTKEALRIRNGREKLRLEASRSPPQKFRSHFGFRVG